MIETKPERLVIALAQINPTVGDVDGNVERIRGARAEAGCEQHDTGDAARDARSRAPRAHGVPVTVTLADSGFEAPGWVRRW